MVDESLGKREHDLYRVCERKLYKYMEKIEKILEIVIEILWKHIQVIVR